jgi:hypothetical protein
MKQLRHARLSENKDLMKGMRDKYLGAGAGGRDNRNDSLFDRANFENALFTRAMSLLTPVFSATATGASPCCVLISPSSLRQI